MEELAKIVRVIRKKDPDAPHNTLLVLDATTGQNAINQAKAFAAAIEGLGTVPRRRPSLVIHHASRVACAIDVDAIDAASQADARSDAPVGLVV